MQKHMDRAKKLYNDYEEWLPLIFFTLGFLLDVFTLGRIDDIFNIITQTLYLSVLFGMLYLDFIEVDLKTNEKKSFALIGEYKDEIFHFLLGALLSAFTIFYFKSSSLSNSFLFMFAMIILLVINEFEFVQKLGLTIKSALLKLCLLSFFIYTIPLIIGSVGTLVFLSSLVVSSLFILAMRYFLQRKETSNERITNELLKPGVVIVVSFMTLYFLKLIPPVPLALNKIGIYHKIEKKHPEYHLFQTTSRWFFWRSGDTVFKARPGDKINVFTSIFSPSGVNEKVFIKWMKDTKDGWKVSDKLPLQIVGGRGKGFRGFTRKSNYTEGDWRVIVETAAGLEIGRLSFEVVKDDSKEKRKYHVHVDK